VALPVHRAQKANQLVAEQRQTVRIFGKQLAQLFDGHVMNEVAPGLGRQGVDVDSSAGGEPIELVVRLPLPGGFTKRQPGGFLPGFDDHPAFCKRRRGLELVAP
jgi:hypothetical protein